MEEQTGIITDIVFRNDSNGYTIAVLETETEYFTVVGTLPECKKGSRFKLTGAFKVHPSYGEQFAFSSFEELMPTDALSIERFLASGVIKGVGSKMAKAIVDEFGDDTLNIIEDNPDRLCEVSGIGSKKAAVIAKSYAERREFAHFSIEFQKIGLTTNASLKLYNNYGKDALELIKENPYRLIEEVPGFGFKKADNIAIKLGIPKDSPFRIKSGIIYVLSYYTGEGSTYVPKNELCEKTAEVLDIPIEAIEETVIEMCFDGSLMMDSLEGQNVVYLYNYYMAEQAVCQNLVALDSASLSSLTADIDSMINMSERDSGMEFSEQQKKAIRNTLTSGVSVITGGPGTGKTTIINTIIRIFESSGFSVAIAAPTGRAAKRITQTSGHYASTVHRLLEYYYSEGSDEMVFGKTKEDQLDYDVIIVDEASMIDLLLMKGLTDAIKPGSRFIMVGDYDQLPSVGAGNVLRDIIESEYVQVSQLKEIFRQAKESMIVVNAHRINHGEYPFFNEKNTDFFFMERRKEKDVLALIIQLVTERLPSYYKDVDALKDIQVLTPVRKGLLGTENMNTELQMVLNPPREGVFEKKFGGKIFRVGDKVMQIRNNYKLGWKRKRDFTEGEGVFNGDVGYVTYIDSEFQKLTVCFDEEKYAEYEFNQLDELEHAYAVTVHKSQGSEFPIVVMPVAWFPPVLATRNLLYTGVTRGKNAVVLVGMPEKLNAMVDNNRIKQRYSGLKPRLEAVIEGMKVR